jgi:hypothetical protein
MSVREPATTCGHDAVETVSLVPDSGGHMYEVGRCAGCGSRLVRSSPLDPWTSAEHPD